MKNLVAGIVTAAILSGTALAMAASAHAQPNCRAFLCVYDSNNNTKVGSLLQTNLLVHLYAGQPYSLSFDHHGLLVNAMFVYTTDCSGPAFQWSSDAVVEPNFAQFDGENIWTSGPDAEAIIARSYSWYWDAATGTVKDQCFRYYGEGSAVIVYEPVLLDSGAQRWVAPFSVRVAPP
jgi:hypothetical protein